MFSLIIYLSYRLENIKFNFIMQKNEKKRNCHFENENDENKND